ncbi:MAG: AMP-binding protein, partial [Alphaproteobacteria bacterium]
MNTTSLDANLNTFPKLLARNAVQFADQPAYREKEYGIWQSWTWSQVQEEVNALAMGMLALGLNAGDHVAVIGRNRPYLYWAMTAAQYCGAIPVPLYNDANAEEMAYVLEHCGARFVIVEDQEQVDKVLEAQETVHCVEEVIYLDKRGMRKYDHTHMNAYEDVQAEGRAGHSRLEPIMQERCAVLNADSTCVMLYTSGTTGRPKGVVLSNMNIISAAASSSEFDNLSVGDSVLAYLPMAWVGDFIFSIGQCFWTGFCVACPESQETMQADLR